MNTIIKNVDAAKLRIYFDSPKYLLKKVAGVHNNM